MSAADLCGVPIGGYMALATQFSAQSGRGNGYASVAGARIRTKPGESGTCQFLLYDIRST